MPDGCMLGVPGERAVSRGEVEEEKLRSQATEGDPLWCSNRNRNGS